MRSAFALAKHEVTFNGKNQAERNNEKKEKHADQIVSVKLNIQPVNSLRFIWNNFNLIYLPPFRQHRLTIVSLTDTKLLFFT